MFSIRGAHIYVLNKESGSKTGEIIVKSDWVTIGAHPLNNIRIPSLEAERRHCKLFADSADSVTIHNFSERNPVLLNGVRLEGKTALQNGDKFEVAGCLFVWNYDPVKNRTVPKSSKRATCLPSDRNPRTLKRVRSFGELVKQGSVRVPRDVGVMLNAIRKRRTIHSNFILPLNHSQKEDEQHQETSLLTSNETAQNVTSVCTVFDSPIPKPCFNESPKIEKENDSLRQETPKLQTTGVMLTSYVSVVERRHIACKTPVSSSKRTPLRQKNETFDKSEMDQFLVNVSNPHDSMHLIDLSTPIKSRPPSAVRKAFCGKVAQSPRVVEAINLVTPSPKKVNRTPVSSKAAAPVTPKVALLKSAIKNARLQVSDTKKTPLPSSLSNKKTPNAKINTVRTDTPKGTPVSSKTALVKLRKHLISSLNKRDPKDTPTKTASSEALRTHSTPVPVSSTEMMATEKDHTTPMAQLPQQFEENKNGKAITLENVTAVEDATIFSPIIDVQAVIKKPNRTTQIRSAKYSDVTPHESFMDGHTPASACAGENASMMQEDRNVSSPSNTLQEHLDRVNDVSPSVHQNTECRLSITTQQHASPQPSMPEKAISVLTCLSVSPMSRVSIVENEPKKDFDTYDLDSEISSLDDDVNEDELLASSDSEQQETVQTEDRISTPQLGHSLRDTRKFIGSAFTSLNTSRPQLDLTAEIDESLLINEEEEHEPECGTKELYNMETSLEPILTNEHAISNNHNENDHTTSQNETVPKLSSELTSTHLSNSLRECLTSKQTSVKDNRRNTLCSTIVQVRTRLSKDGAECVLKSTGNNLPDEEESEHLSDSSTHEKLDSSVIKDSSNEKLNDSSNLSLHGNLDGDLMEASTQFPIAVPVNVVNAEQLLPNPVAVEKSGREMENMFSISKGKSSFTIDERESTCTKMVDVKVSSNLDEKGKQARKSINLAGVKELMKTPKKSNDVDQYTGELNEMFKTPNAVSSVPPANDNKSCVNLVGVKELLKTPKPTEIDVQNVSVMQDMFKTPKPVGFADADPVDKEGSNSTSSGNEVDLKADDKLVTPKLLSNVGKDQTESISAQSIDSESCMPSRFGKVEEEQQTMKTTCPSEAEQNESVTMKETSSTVNELSTPTFEKKTRTRKSVNLAGVKELLKTPKKSNDVEQYTGELNEMFKTPKSVSSLQPANDNESCVNLVGVKELLKTPKTTQIDVQDISVMQDMFKTPKPVGSADVDPADKEDSTSTSSDNENDCKSDDKLVTPKLLSTVGKDQTESISAQPIDTESCIPSGSGKVEEEQQTMKPTCPSEAEQNESVTMKETSSTVNELSTPTFEKKTRTRKSVNLAGVKELLKTPKKSNDVEQYTGELNEMFKTPKSVSSLQPANDNESCVNLVGVKELLKTPKTTQIDVQDISVMQDMFKTPKPVGSTDVDPADKEDSTSTSSDNEDDFKADDKLVTPKLLCTVGKDQTESISAQSIDTESCIPSGSGKVEEQQTMKPACPSEAEQNESVTMKETSSTVNELSTPTVEKKTRTRKSVNLAGVKELLKTPTKSNDVEQYTGELNEMFKTPKSVSSLQPANDNESCVNLVGVKELLKTPKTTEIDVQDMSVMQDMFKNPKPVGSADADKEDSKSTSPDNEDDCKTEDNLVTPKLLCAVGKDQTESISAQSIDTETCMPSSSGKVEEEQQTMKPTCPSEAEQNDSVTMKETSSTVNELSTPTFEKKTRTRKSVNLAGVKELLKTPKKSNDVEQYTGELNEMFKTPKSVSSLQPANANESCVNLVGVKELLKTPKTTQIDVQDISVMQDMFKTPKPVGSADADPADKEDSTSTSSDNENDCKSDDKLVTPKLLSTVGKDQTESISAQSIDTESCMLSRSGKVQEQQTMKPACTSEAEQNDSVTMKETSSTVNELSTPTFEKKTRTRKSVNLTGVKELLKTPKKSNDVDQYTGELNEMFKTPKSVSSLQPANANESCVNLVGVKELLKTPKTTEIDVQDMSAVQDMFKTPKPVGSTDVDPADKEDSTSTSSDNENDCKSDDKLVTPKLLSTVGKDQTESISAQSIDSESCMPSRFGKVEEEQQTMKTTCPSEAEQNESVTMKETSSTVNELSTPTFEKKTRTRKSVNLAGVKELLKTPTKSNDVDQYTGELKEMFKTPKSVSSVPPANDNESCVNLVGVKELLKTPKTTEIDVQDISVMQDMFKTPKPVSSADADKEDSTSTSTENENDCKSEDKLEASKLISGVNQTESISAQPIDAEYSMPHSSDIENKGDQKVEERKILACSSDASENESGMDDNIKNPKLLASEGTSIAKGGSPTVNLVGVKTLFQTPKNSVAEVPDFSDVQEMFKTPNPISAVKIKSEKPVMLVDDEVLSNNIVDVESVKNTNEITIIETASPTKTKTTRKRRLYSKKDQDIKTPDKLPASSPLRGVTDEEYMNIMKKPDTKINLQTEHETESPAKRNVPKRTCRQKIESLSEEFLAGKSPAPKFCKPASKHVGTPNLKEELIDTSTRRRVAFNDSVNVKEFDSPNITGDVIFNASRKTRANKRTTESAKKLHREMEEEISNQSTAHLTEGEASGLIPTKDSLNSAEIPEEQPEQPVTKRGRSRKAKETVDLKESKTKSSTRGGRKLKNVSKASSESEDSVSEKQNSAVVTNAEDMEIAQNVTEASEQDVEELRSPDIFAPVGKTLRKRQPTSKTSSRSLSADQAVSEESVNENETPVKKRVRPGRKAVEAVGIASEKSNTSTPVRRGRTRKDLEKVEEIVSTDKTITGTDDVPQEEETKLVECQVSQNTIESGKDEQNVIKPAAKGRSRKNEAHNAEQATEEVEAKPIGKSRRRKIEEPQETDPAKETSEIVRDEPKAVGRGRRRKIEVQHDEEEAAIVIAPVQDTPKLVGRGRRRKNEVNTEDETETEKEVAAVAQKSEATSGGRGRRRKVEVQTEEESDVEKTNEAKAVGRGRRRKIEEVQPVEQTQKTEEKHEPVEKSRRANSETSSLEGSQDASERKEIVKGPKTTTRARKAAKKGNENESNDSVAADNTVESSPKPETRQLRRTRAKKN